MSETCYGKTLTYDYEPNTNKLQEIRRTAGWGAPPIQPGNGQQYNVDAAGRSGSAHEGLRSEARAYRLLYGDFDRVVGVDLDQNPNSGLPGVEGAEATYLYDHRQQLVEIRNAESVHSYTFSERGHLVSSDATSGSVEYIWLGRQPVGRIGSGGFAILATGSLGQPLRMFTRQDGSTTWTADYEPFGQRSEIYSSIDRVDRNVSSRMRHPLAKFYVSS